VLDEVLEHGESLRPGRREQARTVPTDEADVAVALPPVEVGADLGVDSSSAGQGGSSTPRVTAPFGGGSRLSASKFQRPPAGSPSSISTPCRRRASR